jgi:GDP-4-dehydro-6-deoxy-D-mannose reductase
VARGPALVTGATGFAGGHLIDHLLEEKAEVVAWGNPAGQRAPFAGDALRIAWTSVDVTDGAAVGRALSGLRPSAVYHCAGFADVQRSWIEPGRALQVNAFGTHVLLSALDSAGCDAPVVVTGSALVYRPSQEALTETSPIGPAGPYAVSKLAQEMVALGASGRVIVARPFNHAGPRQSDAYVTSSFARQIAEAEAGLRQPVLQVGNLETWRDITDVRDTVRAYRLLAERGTPGRTYNVCRGEAYRVRDLLEMLIAQSKVSITVAVDASRFRPSDNPVVLGSAARIEQETGWRPAIPIERTLADLLDYWREIIRQGIEP